MQHHVLKLKTDTLNIFFNLWVTITQKPGFKRPTFIFFFLLLWCRFTICRFDHAFFAHCLCVGLSTHRNTNVLGHDTVVGLVILNLSKNHSAFILILAEVIALWSLRKSGTPHPVTHCHFLVYLDPQQCQEILDSGTCWTELPVLMSPYLIENSCEVGHLKNWTFLFVQL